VRAKTPERRLERAASDNNEIGPFLPCLLSHRGSHMTHGNSQRNVDKR